MAINRQGIYTAGRVSSDLAGAVAAKAAEKNIEREEERKRHLAEVENLRNATEQGDGHKLELTRKARALVVEAFTEAMSAGEAIAKEEAKAEEARRQFDDGRYTRAYADEVLAEAKAAEERIRESYARWVEIKSAGFEAELRDAFAVRLESVDASAAAFLMSCDVTAEELRRMTRDAIATPNGSALRMLETAAKRSGIQYENPAPKYCADLVAAFELGADYAQSTYMNDGGQSYRDNLAAVYGVADGALAKAETRALNSCAA